MKKITLLSILVIFIAFITKAQGQPDNMPTDPAQRDELKMHDILYMDALKVKNYKEAVQHVSVLLKKFPNYKEAIYQNGFIIYQEYAETLTDAKEKQAYRDTAIHLLDKRMKLYKVTEDVKKNIYNTKGYYMYDYYSNDPSKYDELLKFYLELVDVAGNSTYYYNADYAMTMNSYAFKNKKIGFNEGVANYQKINTIVQHNIANSPDDKSEWVEVEASVNDMFIKYFKAALTCEFIQKNLTQKYKETKSDKEAEKLLKYLEDAKCTKSAIYLEVLEKASSGEPTYGKMISLAKLNIARGNYAKGNQYYEKAYSYATTPKQKSGLIGLKLNASLKTGNKSNSKALAIKMMQVDPSKKSQAWTTIGNLYMASSKDCPAEGKVKSKAYAIAAYNAYKKAGNSSKMAYAKKYFPASQDVFFEQLKGKSYRLPCWIGETVIFQ